MLICRYHVTDNRSRDDDSSTRIAYTIAVDLNALAATRQVKKLAPNEFDEVNQWRNVRAVCGFHRR